MKILLYGVLLEDNFGGPSILHGVSRLIKDLYQCPEVVLYQFSAINETAIRDMDPVIKQIPYKNAARLLVDGFKYKFNLKPKDKLKRTFFDDIKTADIVANLFGICFCDSLIINDTGYLKSIKQVIGRFYMSFLAKLYGVKTVKCVASYGPINTKTNRIQARFAAKHLFDVMCAREAESKRQMQQSGVKKDICVAPDLANFMPYLTPVKSAPQYVSISVSHQIIRQWDSDEPYVECMANLIRHLIESTNHSVLLIPNEVRKLGDYNDVNVAEDIEKRVDIPDKVVVIDVKKISSLDIKNIIAGSEVMIASRYHSCVAALSTGVPLLVVGWHYKYEELLHWYEQDKWILTSKNCTSKRLIKMFDSLWACRQKERAVIKGNFSKVIDALAAAGRVMFITKDGV